MRTKKSGNASLMVALALVLFICVYVGMHNSEVSSVEAATGTEATETTLTDYYITIDNTVEDYIYYAYQIFSGDYSGGKLTNIEWGSDVNSSGLLTAIVEANEETDNTLYGLFDGIKTDSTAAQVAAAMSNSWTTAQTVAFAELVQKYVNVSGGTKFNYDSTIGYYLEDLDAGYYLIVNTGVPDSEDNTVYSRYMLQVVDSIEISPKSEVPESSKTVDNVNDSDTEDTEANSTGSVADYDYGDDVPFTLTASLSSYFGDYSSYTLIFHDTLSSGLSFNDDVKVYIDGTEISSDYYSVVTSDLSDGCSFHVVINDLASTIKDTSGNDVTVSSTSSIVVKYTAKLNSYDFEQTNKFYLEYSNNPYDKDSTGTTPEDIATVFTYSFEITKTGDSSGNALNGATFTLYKYNDSTNTYEKVEEIEGSNTNIFTFKGLDDGLYKLVETVTPDGYNTMDDLYFTITATLTVDASSGTASASAQLSAIQTDSSGIGLPLADTTFTTDDSGNVKVTIVNYSGSGLPLTGGMGTTILYILGGVLCAAAVLRAFTKRMKAA